MNLSSRHKESILYNSCQEYLDGLSNPEFQSHTHLRDMINQGIQVYFILLLFLFYLIVRKPQRCKLFEFGEGEWQILQPVETRDIL